MNISLIYVHLPTTIHNFIISIYPTDTYDGCDTKIKNGVGLNVDTDDESQASATKLVLREFIDMVL